MYIYFCVYTYIYIYIYFYVHISICICLQVILDEFTRGGKGHSGDGVRSGSFLGRGVEDSGLVGLGRIHSWRFGLMGAWTFGFVAYVSVG